VTQKPRGRSCFFPSSCGFTTLLTILYEQEMASYRSSATLNVLLGRKPKERVCMCVCVCCVCDYAKEEKRFDRLTPN
jgi:hypothetical protein